MKTFKTIILLAFISLAANGQAISEQKLIVKSFRVKTTTTVEVENKYGKLHVINWSKDSVRFEINQMLQSSTEEKLRKLRQSINYNFSGNEYYVIAKTTFGSNYSSFLKDLADFAESIITMDNQAVIDYTIYVPEYVNLKLNNKFGDIFIENIVGDVTINLSNGDLKAGMLKGNSTLALTMSDAEVNTLSYSKLILNYADIHIINSSELNIDSKISTIRIDNTDILKLISRKDKLYVTRLSQLYGEAYFSDIWLYNLDTKANFKVKYSNMNMESIKKGFSIIDFTAEYTDINMFFEAGCSCSVDIIHKKSDVKYPSENANIKIEPINQQEGQYSMFGTFGRGTSDSKLRIQSVSGKINIYQK